MIDKKVACCLCVKDCEKYLPSIFKNLYNLSYEFTDLKNFHVIIVYDNCTDNSEKLINDFKNSSAFNVYIYNYINNIHPWRTVRIANARNKILDIIFNEIKDIDFHFMIDADDINTHKWNIKLIIDYLNLDTWDCLSFNRKIYYDLWALLFHPYIQHVFGYKNCNFWSVSRLMLLELWCKLDELKDNNELIECQSAFNGFALYRTNKFKNIKYNGTFDDYRLLYSDTEFNLNLKYCKQQFNFYSEKFKKLFGDYNLDTIELNLSNGELCEHLYFHICAKKYNNARIMISKHLFS